MKDPIKAVLIGAGQRGGEVYGSYAISHPEQIRFVAVAEPDRKRREQFASQHKIPADQQFKSWKDLLERAQMGEAALICTQDWLHTEPTINALERGYHVLLEKPMATTPEECRQLVDVSERTGLQLHVCHVLRYTPHFQAMRKIVQSGELGQIISVAHSENVSWWHMAHSFVRGNWRNTTQSSPMILAKCCHDFDILLWLLDRECLTLFSLGELTHFRPENAPDGAPDRCLNGCPQANTCPYFAPFIYIDLLPLWRNYRDTASGISKTITELQVRSPGLIRALGGVHPALRRLSDYREWPRSVVAHDPTVENLRIALEEGPYGRCVYHCDNDVVDHQVVSMQFEDGITVTLTMHGHANLEHRSTRIDGSLGTLTGIFGLGGSWIDVREHRSGNKQRFNTSTQPGAGHGGGDYSLMEAFVHSLRHDVSIAHTTARQSLKSHLLAFEAESSRVDGCIVNTTLLR